MAVLAVKALRKDSRGKAVRSGRPLRRKSAGAALAGGVKKRTVAGADAGGKRRPARAKRRSRGTANKGVSFNPAYNEGYNAGFAKGFEDGHQLAYDQQA